MTWEIKNEYCEVFVCYRGSVIAEVYEEFITDLDEILKRSNFSEDDFCKEYNLEKMVDKSMLEVKGMFNADYGYLFFDSKSEEPFHLKMDYDLTASGKTMEELEENVKAVRASLVGFYGGHVIIKKDGKYVAECDGLMSRFTSEDILSIKRSIDSQERMLSRASVYEYGGSIYGDDDDDDESIDSGQFLKEIAVEL